MKRRSLVKAALAGAGTLAAPAYLRAQSSTRSSASSPGTSPTSRSCSKSSSPTSRRPTPVSRSNGSTRRGPTCRPSTRRRSSPARRPTSSTCRARSGSITRPMAGWSTSRPICRRSPTSPSASIRTTSAAGSTRARPTCCRSTSPRRCSTTTRRCSRRRGLPARRRASTSSWASAEKMAKAEKTGFLTLNFDWLYWPLFKMNGVELLSPDGKKAAFNTPPAIEALAQLAKATASGGINKISWTGRWVEPNGAFASGTVGMLHAHSRVLFLRQGAGPVDQRPDAGRAPRRRASGRRPPTMASPFPRGRRIPTSPGASSST